MVDHPTGRLVATADPPPLRDRTSLLSVRDLTVEFTGGDRPTRVVDRVSFDLPPGQVLGVVGESGSGKTVTMLSVMGLLPATARVTSGSITLDGTDLRQLSRAELRHRRGRDLGMIFQHPASSFNPLMTVGAQIVEGLRVHQPGLSHGEARARTVEQLRGVGVPDPASCFTRYPHEYSGGMLQRSMIAMAMANSPKLLIADEPTTALDVTIQAQVLDLLATVRAETGTAIVVVTHNLGLVSAIADEICVMYASRVVERGPVRQVLSAPTHPYTVALLESLPRMGRHRPLVPIPGRMPDLAALPSGCAFHPRCWLSADRARCATEQPPLRRIDLRPGVAACHFAEEVVAGPASAPDLGAAGSAPDLGAAGSAPGLAAGSAPGTGSGPAPGSAPALLAVTGLRKHFPIRSPDQLFGRVLVRAVDGVDLHLPPGRSLALIGESGCGKSTLARTVLRLERPTGGRIEFAGTDLTRIRGRRLRRLRPRMQLVFQDPASALDPRLSAWDTVAEPLRYHRVGPSAAVDDRVAELLEMVELAPELAHRRPHEYSGGQQQRIAIARALALSPELLVLDEPLSALDVSVQAGIINMLNRVRSELGLSYLLISHDLSVVQHLCEEVAVMYLGRVIERGRLPDVFGHPRHPYTRALLSAVPDPAAGPGDRIVLTGEVPSPTAPPSGCRFRTRCWKAQDVCRVEEPPLLPVPPRGSAVACHFPEPDVLPEPDEFPEPDE